MSDTEEDKREELLMTDSRDVGDNYKAVVVALEADRPYCWHVSLTLSAQRLSAKIISLQAIDSTLCLQVKHLHCRLIVCEVSYLAV